MMSRLTTIFLFTFLSNLICSAQNPLVKQWDFSYGGYDSEFLYQLLPTPDGGFVAAGLSLSDASYEKSDDNWDQSTFPTYDTWLIKCDENGVKQWDVTLGGTDDDFFYTIINTADTGYLMLATTRSPQSGNISQGPIGTFDIWAVKLDQSGNVQWDKRYGGSSQTGGSSVVQLSDGGYLIGGYTDSPISGDVSEVGYGTFDFWILRIDAAGNKVWDKKYGGDDIETISKIFQTADGGFLLAGSSGSNASGLKSQDNYVNGMYDMWFVRIDSGGNLMWDKILGSLEDDTRIDMVQNPNGGFFIATINYAGVGGDKTEPSYGVDDFWVMKTDSIMNVIWDHDIGGWDNEDDFGNIFLTAEGNYMISGTTYSPPNAWKSATNDGPENTWIVLIDSGGNKIWDKTLLTGYTHSEAGFSVQLKDGCYLFANDGDSFTEGEKTDDSWSFDYWCIKFCDTTALPQNTGAPLFICSDATICQKFCISFYDSSTNNPLSWQWLFPGGDPASSTAQNPGPVCYNTPGVYDVTLITSNADGTDTLTLPGYITVYATPPFPTITQNGYVLTSSTATTYQWQFNSVDIPAATNQSYAAQQTGYYTVMISNAQGCISSTTVYLVITGIEDINNDTNFKVYPNPSTGIVTVFFSDPVDHQVTITVLNSLGKIVYEGHEQDFNSSVKREVDLSSMPDGAYTFILKSSRHYLSSRVIINR